MFQRRGLLALAGLALTLSVTPTHAAKVRIRGTTSLEARASVDASALTVRGRLFDDAGQGISGSGVHARIRVKASREGAFLRLPQPQGCDSTSAEKVHHAFDHATLPDEYRVDPEAGTGAFCVRLANIGASSGAVELTYEGNAYYAPHTAFIDFDSSERSLDLRFSPNLPRLPLDRPSHIVGVETELEPALAADEQSGTIQLELLFADSGAAARSLGTAVVRPGERAQFEVASRALGRPGPGRLTVRYAGSPSIHGAERSAVVQKTLRVTLSVAGPIQPADPQEGIPIKVAVGSLQGAVSGGFVEGRLGTESVGTAPVGSGVAQLLVAFEAVHAGEASLTLHYLPSSPWWEAGAPLSVAVPIRAPSPWRRLPWLVMAVAVAIWVIQSWRRPGRAQQKASTSPVAPSGRAAVSVIERGPSRSGWRGRVLDAHDGSPVVGARVSILTPAFGGDGIVRSIEADRDGCFSLDHSQSFGVEGARMQTSARWHSSLTRPLPPPGEIIITLVSRRRALLERLVEWTNFRGRPWKQAGDATPEQVATLARQRRAQGVEVWARAIENAAYGPTPVDEQAEEQVRAQEPEWAGTKVHAQRPAKR
jgi:hypothetical protein